MKSEPVLVKLKAIFKIAQQYNDARESCHGQEKCRKQVRALELNGSEMGMRRYDVKGSLVFDIHR